jgi:OPA family glycerol-3-phosphate transporter-like MFS transporter
VCRSNLSVSQPLIVEDASQGITQDDLGIVISVGIGFYAGGKLINGMVADRGNGRVVFLFGMVASVVCTVIFGLGSGLAVLAVVWALNRFVQSMGWPALVKVAGRWFPPVGRATALGALSMSYLVGDAAARVILGTFIQMKFGWRGVFLLSAGLLGVLSLGAYFTLRSGPGEVGLPEVEDTDTKKVEEDASDVRPGFVQLLALLTAQSAFWLICLVSLGLTLIRETFNSWVPTYLKAEVGLTPGLAAIASAVSPLSGAAAALLGGALSDAMGRRHGRVMLPSVLLLVAVLTVMSALRLRGQPVAALVLVGAASFFLIMPYAFCAGVLAIDLGGRRASATASGLVDSAGYVGGVFSGYGIAATATRYGWRSAFGVLAAVAAATAVAIAVYAWQSRPTAPKEQQP